MKNEPAEQFVSSVSPPKVRQVLRIALIVAVYLFIFIILDLFSQQFEELKGIVAWYPPVGLTYALLLVFGAKFTPIVTIALLISSSFIYRMPQPPYLLLLWAVIISMIYGITAGFLRNRIRIDWRLQKLRDINIFVFTIILVSAFLAVLSVLSSALSSDMLRSEIPGAIFRWWIGEAVGVLTITPFLLIHIMPGLKRFAVGQPVGSTTLKSFPRLTLPIIVQVTSLVFILYWVFAAPVLAEYHPVYLIILPLIWIALIHGFKGVTLAIMALNFGVVFALRFFRFDIARLEELQLLMIINCIVGLLMGAVVTERKQGKKEIISLARFPSENPNPVLRLSRDGIVKYANEASRDLLGMWGCAVGGFVPQFWRDLADQTITTSENKTIDIECNGVFYSILISPGVDLDYVNLYGRDITDRIQREQEVRSRTAELTTLYQLSRALAEANDLEKVFEHVNFLTVQSVHTTFAFIALVEDGDLVPRAAYPIRAIKKDFAIGIGQPITTLPFCAQILEQNDPVILQAASSEISSAENAFLMLDIAQTICLVPLHVSDPIQHLNHALGLLIMGEARENKREPFTPEKVHMAGSIGDQAATTIRRLLLHEQAERRLKNLASLSEIDRTIISTFDLHQSLQTVLNHVIEQLEVDAADVLLINTGMGSLEFADGLGFHSPANERKPLRLGDCLAGQAALERRNIIILNLNISGEDLGLPELLEVEHFAAYIAVPLIAKGQIIGVLEIFHHTPLTPNDEWIEFLNTLAGQAAIAIDVVQLFDNLQRANIELELAYDTTIEGWSHALDLRDKETEGHTRRVTEVTVKLARGFGLSNAELKQVRWGALLHDIGKMGVPDGILLKPGPLTDEEWVLMKKHPTFAYEMLSPINYLRRALDIPYCHHEKWDGTGYPQGLKGKQIPLTARIFAVVDVWDALRSDRPYRAAWPDEKVSDHIRSLSGTHFDPQIVEVFLKLPQ
jgi:putative nucleotidyltransferase with HDIG domain